MVPFSQPVEEKYEQGSSPTFLKKSFAAVLGGNFNQHMILQGKKAVSFRGEPAVMLNDQELHDLCAPLKLALIGSFSRSRPTMQQIRDFFIARGFKGSVDIGLLNQRQILIRPTLEEDYIRIWEKRLWNINSSTMRVVKWSPISHRMQESSIAPVWIAFPYLPVHCFEKSMLFALASAFGTPLKVDEPTANLTRPSVARVLVEVDASKVHKERIWIGGEKDGFYQRVVFENMPKYCQFCYKMGHAMEDCNVKATQLKEGQEDKAGKNNVKVVPPKKPEVTQKVSIPKTIQQKYVPKIGVIEVEKGKAAQTEFIPPMTNAEDQLDSSTTLLTQPFEDGTQVGVALEAEEGDHPGLTCVTNTEVNSIPSNSSGSPGMANLDDHAVTHTCIKDVLASSSPSLEQAEKEKVLAFSSAPSSPMKDGSTRPLATCRFAHTDNDSGEVEAEEEEEEESDEELEEDPDYSSHMRNYDFYAYSSSKKGFRIGRLMGNSRR